MRSVPRVKIATALIVLTAALAACGCGQTGSSTTNAAESTAVPIATMQPLRSAPKRGRIPAHVLTYQFFGINGVPKGYPKVKDQVASRWVTWAMSGPRLARGLQMAGMNVVYYSDPNRVAPRDKDFSTDETEFAHDCSGARVRVKKGGVRYLTDPSSPVTAQKWKAEIAEALPHGFAAIFDDTAGSTNSLSALPCGFNESKWIDAHISLVESTGQPVIINGLGDGNLPQHGRGPGATYDTSPLAQIVERAPNAIGGAFEDCYASPSHPSDPGGTVTAGSFWRQTENTELAIARIHKIFVCNERADNLAMEDATDARIFCEASFLLTYDLDTSMVRQQFIAPSQLNLGPEVKLVAIDPVVPSPRTIEGLRASRGAYGREYRSCYIQGTPVGPCAAAVNPDRSGSVPFPFAGYGHTMELQGSGIEDGGLMDMSGPAPATIAPLQGVVAFK